MNRFSLLVLASLVLLGCSVYDPPSPYGIGSDQWHDMVKKR